VEVGMVFLRHLAVCFFQFVLAASLLDAEDFIIISFISHSLLLLPAADPPRNNPDPRPIGGKMPLPQQKGKRSFSAYPAAAAAGPPGKIIYCRLPHGSRRLRRWGRCPGTHCRPCCRPYCPCQ